MRLLKMIVFVVFMLTLAESLFAEEAPASLSAPADAENLKSKSAAELVALGNKALSEDDVNGAILHYGAAQIKAPGRAEIYHNLGLAYARRGELEEACEQYYKAAGKSSGALRSMALYNLGNARVHQGRLEDAAQAYEDAIRADAENISRDTKTNDAVHNLEIVRNAIEHLKAEEEARKRAEEEFKKRLKELLGKVAELLKRQSEMLITTWSVDKTSVGRFITPDELKNLQKLFKAGKPIDDSLLAKLGRIIAKENVSKFKPKVMSNAELVSAEQGIATEIATCAKEARILSDMLTVPAQQNPNKPPTEQNPVKKLIELATMQLKSAEQMAQAAAESFVHRSVGYKQAEESEATSNSHLLLALSLLTAAEKNNNEQVNKLQEFSKEMGEIRKLQAELIRNLWESYPESRGMLPTPEVQESYWSKAQQGDTPELNEVLAIIRLDILTLIKTGKKLDMPKLQLIEEKILGRAETLLGKITAELNAPSQNKSDDEGAENQNQAEVKKELESYSAKIQEAIAAMKTTVELMSNNPDGKTQIEMNALLAYRAFTRLPTQMEEITRRIGIYLSRQMKSLADSWQTDESSKGKFAIKKDFDALAEMRKNSKGQDSKLPDELMAKLGRALTNEVIRSNKDKMKEFGQKRSFEEISVEELELAQLLEVLSSDIKTLAASGGEGEMNSAAPMLEVVDKLIVKAGEALLDAYEKEGASIKMAEPASAMAVMCLAEALAKMSSGATGESEQNQKQQQEKSKEQKSEQKKSDQQKGEKSEENKQDENESKQDKQGEQSEEDKKKAEEEDRRRAEELDRLRAESLLEEIASEEREVRRDMRKRTGEDDSKERSVTHDW